MARSVNFDLSHHLLEAGPEWVFLQIYSRLLFSSATWNKLACETQKEEGWTITDIVVYSFTKCIQVYKILERGQMVSDSVPLLSLAVNAFKCDLWSRSRRRKGSCDVCVHAFSVRIPLDEDAVHDSFKQLIAEHSQNGAPSEAFELQQLQRELTEESQGVTNPSECLKLKLKPKLLAICKMKLHFHCSSPDILISQTTSITCSVVSMSLEGEGSCKGMSSGRRMKDK